MTAPHVATLVQAIQARAVQRGDSPAYTFIPGGAVEARSISWAELDQRAATLGSVLLDRGAAGERVLLALPSGLTFIESLFACWYAGATVVPISLPRHRRINHQLKAIVADADARFVIGAPETRGLFDALRAGDSPSVDPTWIDAETASSAVVSPSVTEAAGGADIALLQYTSGSTGVPRGVMVTHDNLMHNSNLIADACGHTSGQTIGGWLPLFHDMGLIGLVLQAACAGTHCVLIPPERFLMSPLEWLRVISDYQIHSSPAPNFAFDLCVDRVTDDQKLVLDLSHWKCALNGSEPVRATTLERFAAAFERCGFRPQTFSPCYGLAEATLFVTGHGWQRDGTVHATDGELLTRASSHSHVSCGRPFGDTQIAIVDPQTNRRVAPGAIGEIWVAGASCTAGYWNDPAATAETFVARIDDPGNPAGSDQTWLRTGDLGFVADDELFITGRLRELIIVSGRNHFPVDIERTVESTDSAITRSGSAAFAIDTGATEQLVIVAEVRRDAVRSPMGQSATRFDAESVTRRVRAAVASEHDIRPHDIVLVRPWSIPRTTSGKIRRRATRDQYVTANLKRLEVGYHATDQ